MVAVDDTEGDKSRVTIKITIDGSTAESSQMYRKTNIDEPAKEDFAKLLSILY